MTAPDLGRALTRFRRPNPLLVAVRWRYELAAAAGTVASVRWLGLMWTVLGWLGLVAAAAAVPGVRRRLWCVVTAHRVRTGCKHAWVHSRTGRIPAVLRTRPVAGGEEVLLWCRPGTSAADLAAAGPLLAAACWARAVVVEPVPARPYLVRLTVLRS